MGGRREVILHAFSTFDLGGPQARFARCVDYFGDRFRHVVVAMDRSYGALDSISNRQLVEVLELPVRKGGALANVPLLTSALRKLTPTRVVTYNWGSIEWAFAAGWLRLPHVHVEEGFGAEEVERRLPRRSLTRFVALRFSRAQLITVSSTMRRIALREWRIPEKRCTLIPNGVNVDAYGDRTQRVTRSCYARSDEEVVVGTVAKLRPEKSVDRLIEAVVAARQTCQLRLVIVGDGPELAALQRLVSRLGLKEDCLFFGMRSDLHKILPELDIFALSSDTEQMPIAMLEAMAAGLPVAATDVGDVWAILPESSAEFIVRRDAGDLAQAIAKLAGDPERRLKIGLDNRARIADHYTDTRMFEQWEKAYAGEFPLPAPTQQETRPPGHER